eukprot:16126639-Heterocapsa_arctica.AAC.1
MAAAACTTAAQQAGSDSLRFLWNGPPGNASSRLQMCSGESPWTGAILAWLRSPMRKVTPPG